jgi:hypothetical protein
MLSACLLKLDQRFEERASCLGDRTICELRAQSDLTNRWSGRVIDKVPSSNVGVRAAQLNR